MKKDEQFLYFHIVSIILPMKMVNRIKIVLVEQNRTGKRLAEQLNKNEATVSRWCTNESQPSLDTLIKISGVLNVDVRDLLMPTKII